MNLKELSDYEKLNEYKSFGRKCDELYQKLDLSKCSTKDEVINLVKGYAPYLQLVEDKDGELVVETSAFAYPARYLANADKMYQIGNTVYRLFEGGIVSAEEQHTDKLLAMTEESYEHYENDPDIRIEKKQLAAKSACPNSVDDYESSGNNRTHITNH